jgi:FixJ family two-component response regulator
MNRAPTVFVVDDDAISRAMIARIVASMKLPCETFESAEAFLARYEAQWPGCLVVDVQMEGMSGIELQKKLLALSVSLPTIVITAYAKVSIAVAAMKLHAVDFVEKPIDPAALAPAIQKALSADEQNRHAQSRKAIVDARLPLLTRRERQVMDLVVNGLANKQIAASLNLSEKTVETHRGHVMQKMGADSLAQLVRMAVAPHTVESDNNANSFRAASIR